MGNSNLLYRHVAIVKLCFLLEVHPPLSKTDEQKIFILVLSSLSTQMAQGEAAGTCQMKHWVGLRQPLSCSTLQRYSCLLK